MLLVPLGVCEDELAVEIFDGAVVTMTIEDEGMVAVETGVMVGVLAGLLVAAGVDDEDRVFANVVAGGDVLLGVTAVGIVTLDNVG